MHAHAAERGVLAGNQSLTSHHQSVAVIMGITMYTTAGMLTAALLTLLAAALPQDYVLTYAKTNCTAHPIRGHKLHKTPVLDT